MKNNLSYRVGKLEEKSKDIVDKLDKIRTNELPHIQSDLVLLKGDIKALDKKVDEKFEFLNSRFLQATAINIGAIILVAVLTKIFL